MRLFFTPIDVLFFRSPLPFTAGEDTGGQSVFPPTPEAMQGMLRALIASHWAPTLAQAFEQPDVRALVGDRASVGRFRLTSLTLGRRIPGTDHIERLFPGPAHLQRLEPADADSNTQFKPSTAVLLTPDSAALSETPDRVTNLPAGLRMLVPTGKAAEAVTSGAVLKPFDAWLTEDELNTCLHGSPSEVAGIKGVSSGAIYTFEPRIGIGIEPGRRTAREGFLYQQTVVRMEQDCGLVVDIELDAAPTSTSTDQPSGSTPGASRIVAASELLEALHLQPSGWAQLGGERRAVRYEVCPDPDPPRDGDPTITPQPAQRSLLYFATPTYFRNGWRPEIWEATFGVAPVAAAVPRMQLIGGWRLDPDSARGDPKPLRRCVPAGSVYFFDQPLTAPGPYADYGGEIGYGHAIEGTW